MKNKNGSEDVYYGPWQILVAVKHCPCEDGKSRYVRIIGQPDTYFSVPGRIQVRHKGKRYSIRGWVGGDEQGSYFRAYIPAVSKIASKLTGLEEETPAFALADKLTDMGQDWLVPFLKVKKT